MKDIEAEFPKMPEGDSPLSPIVSWYNVARKRANAPSIQIEAHFLSISIPRLRNIRDVNQFDDEQIELLDKHSIDLNIAAAISQNRDNWQEIMTDEYLNELVNSPHRLTHLWITKKGDSVDTNDMMDVFIKEGFCGFVYQQRMKTFGKPKNGFERTLQSILQQIARGKYPTPKQMNVVFQAINEERDKPDFNWVSASLKTRCPKSVDLIERWGGY